MANDALHTYLNDHLAGSVAALKMLDSLMDDAESPALEQTFSMLRAEIGEDQQTLQQILSRVGGNESAIRQLGGVIADKLKSLKLMVDDPAHGTLQRLETLEMLALGVHGKRSLWVALKEAVPGRPALEGIDFERLILRAENQYDRLEGLRLETARRVLAAPATTA